MRRRTRIQEDVRHDYDPAEREVFFRMVLACSLLTASITVGIVVGVVLAVLT